MTTETFPSTYKRTILQTLALLCGCIVAIALLTLATKPSNTSASAPIASPRAGAPLSGVLNADGTVNTAAGPDGSFDPTDYRMVNGADGEPHFVPNVPGDENWQQVPNGTDGQIFSLSPLDSTSFYAAGTFSTAGGNAANNLAKWNSSTGLWTPQTGAFFNSTIYSSVITGSTVYLGGSFTAANGGIANSIAQYDIPSGVTSQLGTGTNGLVVALVVHGSDLYIGGSFTMVDNIPVNYMAKWSTVTHTWSSVGGGVSNGVWAMAMHGTDLYVGCYCGWAGDPSIHVNTLAKYDTISSNWSAVRGGVPGLVHTIVFDGSDMYVGGEFETMDNPPVAANHIAKYNVDTDTWSTFGVGVGYRVFAIAINGNNLYVGGSFTYAGGQPAQHIAKWDITTQTWSPMGSGVTYEVDSLVYQNGNLYVGGQLDAAGGLPSNRVAIWHEPGVATSTPTATTPAATSTATRTSVTSATATRTAISTTTRTATRTATVVSSSVTPSATATPCTSYTYTDMPCGSTFYPFVECLVSYEIVNGYPCGLFPDEPCDSENRAYYRPNNNVTRGQIAKIVSRAAGFDDNSITQLFEDVAPGSTFYPYVQALAYRGYISGYECGHDPNEPCGTDNLHYYRPNTSASRGQVSKIITRAAGYTDPHTDEQTFEDVPKEIPGNPGTPAHPFHDYVEELYSRGVIGGYECGHQYGEPCVPPLNRPYFRPAETTKRGQLTKFVAMTFFPGCPSR